MQNREQQFLQIIHDNKAAIYRICSAYLFDNAQRNDLYQEIMMQVWQSIPAFRGEARVSTWLYRIAVNTAIAFNQRQKKQVFESLPETLHEALGDEEGKQDMETAQQLEHLRSCICTLDEGDRIIVSLVLEGLSYKEIAEVTGGNPNLIGVKMFRIKKRLANCMERRNHHGL